MAIKFNDYNYDNYKLAMFRANNKDTQKAEQEKEVSKSDVEFKGLKNEEDLLTQNTQNIFGVNLAKFTKEDLDIADTTNEIMASLGYNYKVSASQVASVTSTMENVVKPDLKIIEDGAVAQNIQDPNGPFADLFA